MRSSVWLSAAPGDARPFRRSAAGSAAQVPVCDVAVVVDLSGRVRGVPMNTYAVAARAANTRQRTAARAGDSVVSGSPGSRGTALEWTPRTGSMIRTAHVGGRRNHSGCSAVSVPVNCHTTATRRAGIRPIHRLITPNSATTPAAPIQAHTQATGIRRVPKSQASMAARMISRTMRRPPRIRRGDTCRIPVPPSRQVFSRFSGSPDSSAMSGAAMPVT